MHSSTPQNLAAFREAAAQAPDDIDRWVDLCEAAEKQRDYAEVLRAGDCLARLAPDRPQPHFIRGLALQQLDRIEEAIAAYLRVNALDPDYADAWVNLGHCCQALNRLPEAEDACRRAIAAGGQAIAGEENRAVDESEYGHHHWNLAVVELLKGDYARGFARYPARFRAIAEKKRPDFARPLWRGENLRGKTILITADQGHGDTLMMARYLPLLRERGARAVLQAQPALAPLLENWDGVDSVIAGRRDPVPAFDYHASEFDLPHYFGTTLATVPVRVPYLPLLPPDEATRLPHNGQPKIGVVWGGNPEHRNDARRSIPLGAFAGLFETTGVRFFNLNRDMRAGDAGMLARLPVIDLAPRLNDFAATARFIGQLDLVISCDTAIAHLAGGMGKPVWVLLPFAPSWHWMLTRADSPWYPTARLFRQTKRGDWADVMGRVRAAVEKL